MFRYKIISVTGTKGKTSVVRMLDYLFLAKKNIDVLRVDSDGHYLNGIQRSTFKESVKFYWLYPTLAPGRFLYEFKDKTDGEGVAIFESSIGCSRGSGTAYNLHHVGIFTNVFEDHLDGRKLKTKKDILQRKSSFILRIYNEGSFVYNYDDELLRGLRNKIRRKKLDLVAVSLDYSVEYLKKKLRKEVRIITVKDDKIIQLGKRGEDNIELLDLNKFDNAPIHYKPFIYNLLFTLAGALSYGLSIKDLEAIYNYQFSFKGGRMTLFKVDDKFVLLDYAHEKYSLKSLAEYVRATGRYNIGVIRLDYKRTLQLIKETGQFLADEFDEYFIYDKIDGVKEGYYMYKGEERKKGQISKILFNAIKNNRKKNKKVYRYLQEKLAFQKALQKIKKGGIVVLIVDDLQADLKFLKKQGAKRVKFSELYKIKNV